MENQIINFKNFTFQYDAQSKPTLYDINLEINKGEKILIVGASGSGKSTLANCINGMIPFRFKGSMKGCATVKNTETNSLSIFQLSKIVGTVLQDPDGQFIGLTVGEDIAFALENEATPYEKMIDTVNRVSILTNSLELLNHAPYELSGGQKQRVSLAGIMVNDVDILLFDEPLASLDPATGKNSMELISDIKKNTNSTVIIVEHRLEDVLWTEMDRIILMKDGRIVQDMTPKELLKSSFLVENGIREPLYITALKYAGVDITDSMEHHNINTLTLDDSVKNKVIQWFENTTNNIIDENKEKILEIKNLSFGYNQDKLNLNNINLSINKGEIVSIVGKNGAGKTTLSKLICGFLKPLEGEILLNGKNISTDTISQRAKKIGYVMQNPNQMISKNMIYDEIALGLINSSFSEEEKKEKIEKAMQVCGIYKFRNWPISALSFGQKKRVTIASILVLEPEIIILDEPTAGQDFKHYTEIMEFLVSLKNIGITIVLITHDMHLMLEYTTKAFVFADSQLLKSTTPADLLCSKELTKKASLKETSLFNLATMCGINDPVEYINKFISYDKEVRKNG